MPIGRPIANTRVYVLDGHLQPVPIGVVGELYVGGVVVGRGYLNDPEQTRRRFLRDPFTRHRSARLYRTGDLVRWRTDRTLEFFGRADEQVKIRGHRVELKEIEHTLTECADIQAAAVLPRHDLGEARLIAYIVPAPERQPAVETIRDFLKTKLPGYMIPSGFVFLKRMPLTAHGKVDRRALAATNMEPKTAGSAVVASRTPIEKILAEILADLLKTDVGVSDNFFDLGGIRFWQAKSSFGSRLPLGCRCRSEQFSNCPRSRHLPATSSKRAHHALTQHSTSCMLRKPGTTPRQSHKNTCSGSSASSRVYRDQPPVCLPPAGFAERGRTRGERGQGSSPPRRVAHPISLGERPAYGGHRLASEVASPLLIEDLTANATIRSRHAKPLLLKKIELRSEQEAWKTFDVSRAPLFRMRLWRLGQDDHVLVLILHHAMFDGWSARVLLDEVSDVYAALTTGRRQTRVDPAPQFVDFARWQRRWSTTDGATRQLTYWREHLRGLAPLFPSAKNDLGSLVTVPSAHERIHMTHDLVKRLNALSLSQGGTVFMTLLTAFKALLLARAGRNDICIATSMANRSTHGHREHDWPTGEHGAHPLPNRRGLHFLTGSHARAR